MPYSVPFTHKTQAQPPGTERPGTTFPSWEFPREPVPAAWARSVHGQGQEASGDISPKLRSLYQLAALHIPTGRQVIAQPSQHKHAGETCGNRRAGHCRQLTVGEIHDQAHCGWRSYQKPRSSAGIGTFSPLAPNSISGRNDAKASEAQSFQSCCCVCLPPPRCLRDMSRVRGIQEGSKAFSDLRCEEQARQLKHV